MSDREFDDFRKKLKDYGTEVTKTKESSQKFLKEIGVITKSGNIKASYKNLCTQPKLD